MVSEPAQNSTQRGIDFLLEEVAQRRLNGNASEARTAAMERQHGRGKLSARERLDILFDAGSFTEIDPFVKHRGSGFGLENNRPEGDAVVVGHGTVDGRTVFAYAQDFTLYGGSVSEAAAEKIAKIQDLSMKVGAPIVAINDGGGARIQEGVTSLRGYGEIFLRNTLSSGLVPQIAVCAGPAAGGGVYSPAIMDFIFMVQGTGQMYITGPDVIRAVSGEEVTHEELGGAMTHATRTGVAHFCIPGEEATLNSVRQLLTFLPQNNMEDPRWTDTGDSPERKLDNLVDIVPADSTRPYDIRRVIREIVDNGEFMEIQAQWARNVAIGFGHMGGYGVGIVANDPDTLAGVLDIDASRKAARFVRFCDCFNIPIVTLVDVPGFLPGTQQEYGGIIAHGAKLLYAYAEATVPGMSPPGSRQDRTPREERHHQCECPDRSKHRGRDRGWATPPTTSRRCRAPEALRRSCPALARWHWWCGRRCRRGAPPALGRQSSANPSPTRQPRRRPPGRRRTWWSGATNDRRPRGR